MKSLLVATIFTLLSSTTFAQSYGILKCKVANPCQYLKSGLGYCIGTASIRINDRSPSNKLYSHMVVSKMNQDAFESFQIAADYPVTFLNSGRAISGQSETGDDWVQLQAQPNSETYYGKMTLEQDFEFSLTCAHR